MFWYILIIGIGIFLLTMALCKTAAREDRRMERQYNIHNNKCRGDEDDNT